VLGTTSHSVDYFVIFEVPGYVLDSSCLSKLAARLSTNLATYLYLDSPY
jgi:hypothetical protein